MTDVPINPHFAKPLAVRLFLARSRLFVSMAIGIAAALMLPDSLVQQTITRAIIGWNVGAILYLVLAIQMIDRRAHV